MKIICSKEDFAKLVRNCEKSISVYPQTCSGCVFSTYCAQSGDVIDDEIMVLVEDICEIEVSVDG